MSTTSLPAVVTASPTQAERFRRRVEAELALADLERAVQRLARRLDPVPIRHSRVPRRSRRSAWSSSIG